MSALAVLLCTYNGGPWLSQQLTSISRQTVASAGVNIEVHASDDGSTDDTLPLLEQWRDAPVAPLKSLRRGPGTGHAANFLSLLAAPDLQADFFAFADQDDLWDSDKLERALASLARIPAPVPALYCARTRSVTATGAVCGESPCFTRPPSFRNALLQNIAGGNTMVMNRPARELLGAAGAVDVVSHDWWAYLLVSGAGGTVIFDQQPCLSYRQHGGNAIGDNLGAGARLARYREFLRGRNRAWYARNAAALGDSLHLLTDGNKSVYRAFVQLRDATLAGRFRALRASGVYAQTTIGQLGLYSATLLKKI